MEPPWNSEVRQRATLFAVGIWVSYVTSCYVTSCSVCPGSSVALGGGGGGGHAVRCRIGTELEQIGNIYSKRIFLAHIITNSSANG